MVKLLRNNRRVQIGVILLGIVTFVIGLVIVTRPHLCMPSGGKGDKIAFDNQQDIFVMDADGSNVCRLTSDEAHNTNPTWSPDGKQLAFFSNRDRNAGIYIMNADGSNVHSVRATSPYGGLAWSADGKQLAFVADEQSDLSVMDIDGSNVRPVTDRSVYGHVNWSPDGKSIALTTSSGKWTQVSVVDIDGSNLHIMADERTAGFADYQNPAWAPDGQWIALDNKSKICLVKADGSNGHCLDVNPTSGNNTYPTWSPDSQRIAFVSYDIGSSRNGIYVMNADGTNVSRLSEQLGSDLAWSP